MTLTQVWREFPFPTEYGRFVTEALVYHRRSTRYRTRYFNDHLLSKQYHGGGLTDQSLRHRVESAIGAATYYQEFIAMGRPMPWDIKLKQYVNFVRFARHARMGWSEQMRRAPSRALWLACAPLGIGLALQDRWRLRRAAQRG